MMERHITHRPSAWRLLGQALAAVSVALALAVGAQAQTTHRAAATKSSVRPLPNLPSAAPAKPAAVAGTNQQIIYGGQDPSGGSQSGVSVADWGGGTVEVTANQAYMQGHSLKIVTKGPFQGGQILFANPVSLGNVPQEKNRYFQLVISVAEAPSNQEFNASSNDQMGDASPTSYWGQSAIGAPRFQLVQARPGGGRFGPPIGGYGPPGGFRPPMGGYGPGGMPPGAMAPGGYPGQTQQPGQQTDEENSGLAVKSLHLIFQLADGSQADVVRPVPQNDTTGWIRVALPLSVLSFPGSSASNAQLKSLIVAGDAPATIYVGEIRTIDDDTPITAIPPDEQDVAANDEVTFQGSGDGGASSLKYTWDFDTKGAFAPEAEGQTVTHHYKKSGDYKVTLIVSDLDGIKKPATVTSTVHVEE